MQGTDMDHKDNEAVSGVERDQANEQGEQGQVHDTAPEARRDGDAA